MQSFFYYKNVLSPIIITDPAIYRDLSFDQQYQFKPIIIAH